MKDRQLKLASLSMFIMLLSGCAQRQLVRFHTAALSPPPVGTMLESHRTAPGLVPFATDEAPITTSGNNLLEVDFINVGQGDCTLIMCPNGKRVLVDAGSSSKNFNPNPVRTYLLSKLDTNEPRVDALVITHPDSDHYNLLRTVLKDIDVGHVYMAGAMTEHSKADIDAWLEEFEPQDRTRLRASEYNVSPPKSLGDFGEVQILVLAANVKDTTVDSETNTRSIVLKVSYGTQDFMLTGDATRDTENDIMQRLDHDLLDVEVLKMGHHGSSATSTSEEWAATVKPEIAIASAGKFNTYGHPNRVAVGRLEPYTVGVKAHRFRWSWREKQKAHFQDFPSYEEAIYSTAINGNIAITTDGNNMDMLYEQ